ncbi:MAG: mannose-1-phosphate guanylyltransferase/mannose-6-phosphate isomerase [Candidatus Thiodiazotropha endolucinida]|uniref:mannose-1-phosphate guanylyltransferase n=1 Tax=Candidatus Thiodiazotropha taylori TaxID=2792791 RepID=A0A9E4NH11_9GAMM|nr:mannose-1-phosphate guanylyltransferase/mannose-6-phosphate isomerase [Candidatus Thiodiazotropha taylori]MCG7976935.1 mannose-1-phosphate guanylyltransferase/mannose-6-phosphate isomerase [Candidatus Thiodiazotropha taylori]MCW4235055.1 mannose-1-phosphate guanylyltransferase/mannose-6-phosphate isomerase [Candidatus Thiodiazotropha endolucinida]
MIIPVILSGGSGTRLWPLSRSAYPKQFIPLTDEKSLFQQTLERMSGISDAGDALIVCNEEHRFMVAEQMRQLNITSLGIMLEPIGRNTAPAIACAAHYALSKDKDAVLVVTPSDHVIRDNRQFVAAMSQGLERVDDGSLVTFGIVPDKPETGYGYIRKQDTSLSSGAFPVAEFVEKPDLETAKGYLASGDFYWNSGMFVFRADAYLQELEQFHPDILQATIRACELIKTDLDFLRLDKEAFNACPAKSIDYAVMEKTAKSVVVPMDAGWSDVGSWSALADVSVEEGNNGNVLQGDVLIKGVSNSYLRSENRMIAGIGLDNVIVVETADAVLVADKSHVQDVKGIVEELKASGRCEYISHVRVYRPWGNYETVDECDRFKVKRIVVNPGASLSLQQHHHRAEHWVVVKGTAQITKGEKEILLTEDQSVYIPLGTKHRLTNPGLIPLEIVEVQTGSYLGEDDIVRFSDEYGRDNC